MKFSEMYHLEEAVTFKTSDDVINSIKDGTIIKYLNGKKNLPSWIKEVVDGKTVDNCSIDNIKHYFETVIDKIKNTSTGNTVPNSAILLLIKKSDSPSTMKAIIETSVDTLVEYAKAEKSEWIKKLSIYDKLLNEPYNTNVWHSFEKESQERRTQVAVRRNKSLDTTQKSDLYTTLYEDGTWGLYMPKNQAGDSELASHMVPFKKNRAYDFGNDSGEDSKIITKAQWCTAADPGYYTSYSSDGNGFYVIKRYNKKGICDEAFQAAFSDYRGVEFKDKFDNDNKSDDVTNIRLAYDAPDKLLSLIVNDNPEGINKSSFLDYKNYLKALDGYDLDSFTIYDYYELTTEELEAIKNLHSLPNFKKSKESIEELKKFDDLVINNYAKFLSMYPYLTSDIVGIYMYSRISDPNSIIRDSAKVKFNAFATAIKEDPGLELKLDEKIFSKRYDDQQIVNYIQAITNGQLSEVPKHTDFDPQYIMNLDVFKQINNIFKELNLTDIDKYDCIIYVKDALRGNEISWGIEDLQDTDNGNGKVSLEEFKRLATLLSQGKFERLKREHHDVTKHVMDEIGGIDNAVKINDILEKKNLSFKNCPDLANMPYDFLKSNSNSFEEYIDALTTGKILSQRESGIYGATSLSRLPDAIELKEFLVNEGLINDGHIWEPVLNLIRNSNTSCLSNLVDFKEIARYFKELKPYHIRLDTHSISVCSVESLNSNTIKTFPIVIDFIRKYDNKINFDCFISDFFKFSYLDYDKIEKLYGMLGDCIDKGYIETITERTLSMLERKGIWFETELEEIRQRKHESLFRYIYNKARI